MRKREVRAAEYRQLATAALDLAEASVLTHVREKHQKAAARWTALAILDERPVQSPPTYPPRPAPIGLGSPIPQADQEAPCTT